MAHMLDPAWKTQIPRRSLERGRAYAWAGACDHIDRAPGGWKMTVRGTMPYRVFVSDAKTGTVAEKATCTCPWFEKGNLCKHIAAACFALDGSPADRGALEVDALVDAGVVRLRSDQADIVDLVCHADEVEMRAFLLQALLLDDRLAHRFRLVFDALDAETARRSLLGELDAIADAYGRDGYIDYRDMGAFTREYLAAVQEAFAPFEQRHHAEGLFGLACAVAEDLSRREVDDSDGFADEVITACLVGWTQALGMAPDGPAVDGFLIELRELSDRMLKGKQRGYFGPYVADQIDEFLCERYGCDPDYAWAVLDLADDRIAWLRREHERREKERLRRMGTGAGQPRFAIGDHETPRWVAVRLRAMYAMGESVDDALDFARPYAHDSRVLAALFDILSDAGREADAIGLLEEALAGDDVSAGAKRGLRMSLRDVYREAGKADRLRETLVDLIIDSYGLQFPTSVELMGELRETVPPGEWPAVRDDVLSRMVDADERCECLAAEGLVDRLAAELERGQTRYRTPAAYRDLLLPDHADVLVRWYRNSAERLMGRARDRRAYRSAVRTLEELSKIPGGISDAIELAGAWTARYRGRPALLDELRTAGF